VYKERSKIKKLKLMIAFQNETNDLNDDVIPEYYLIILTIGVLIVLVVLKIRYLGNQGNKWFDTNVSIGRRKTAFTIEFEAKRGLSWSGDIAIDSVSMINCEKPSQCIGQIPSDSLRLVAVASTFSQIAT